ncbi:MAG TPA: TIGR02444 family protein [Pseudolabrys sp.]|jgi:uncharacterized protein (TIGR02444 family)
MPKAGDVPRAAGRPLPSGDGDSALDLDNAFWRFSLAVYASDGVAQECLALQDSSKADVNLLLFCAWMGARNIALTRRDLEAAGLAVEVWHAGVVRRLRGVRQQIKALARAEFEAFRAQVKSLELEAEQVEQAILYVHAQTIEPAASGAEAREIIAENIRMYLEAAAGDRLATSAQLPVACLIEAALRQTPV